MTLLNSISMLAVLIVLAAVPSTSVLFVVTRAATLGLANGIAASVGIVLGDLVFILLVVFGLSVVAETMGGVFLAIKYLGGIYLIWLGVNLIRSRNTAFKSTAEADIQGSCLTSCLAGFLLTLGDIKAIFFYLSLFPTFVDLVALQMSDILLIVLITIIGVGGVKVTYAFYARRVATFSRTMGFEKASKIAAGSCMISAGTYLIVKN